MHQCAKFENITLTVFFCIGWDLIAYGNSIMSVSIRRYFLVVSKLLGMNLQKRGNRAKQENSPNPS